MNSSDLALERIVTVPPLKVLSPCEADRKRIGCWSLGWSVHAIRRLGYAYNCWVLARPTVQTLSPTSLCQTPCRPSRTATSPSK